MILNELKAEFSHAYVRAVAHAAGFFTQDVNRMTDSDGVDLTILERSEHGTVRSPRLDIQLKATTAPSIAEDSFPFVLPIKNYDELRSEQLQVPRVLVVVVVPEDRASWVEASKESLVLRRCGYWKSLRGSRPTDNKATITIQMNRADCFHVEQVSSIMERIRDGGLP